MERKKWKEQREWTIFKGIIKVVVFWSSNYLKLPVTKPLRIAFSHKFSRSYCKLDENPLLHTNIYISIYLYKEQRDTKNIIVIEVEDTRQIYLYCIITFSNIDKANLLSTTQYTTNICIIHISIYIYRLTPPPTVTFSFNSTEHRAQSKNRYTFIIL